MITELHPGAKLDFLNLTPRTRVDLLCNVKPALAVAKRAREKLWEKADGGSGAAGGRRCATLGEDRRQVYEIRMTRGRGRSLAVGLPREADAGLAGGDHRLGPRRWPPVGLQEETGGRAT